MSDRYQKQSKYKVIIFPFSEWKRQMDEVPRIISVLGSNTDYERLVVNRANKIKTHLELAVKQQCTEI